MRSRNGESTGIEKKYHRPYSKGLAKYVFHGHYLFALCHCATVTNEQIVTCNSTFVYSNVYLNISLYLNK